MAGEIKPLPRDFYARGTQVVAFELIGKRLVFKRPRLMLIGRIVETEAYLGGDDPASHAFPGPTRRNRIMFGPPGFSYVYFSYGNHYCFNVVTEQDGTAGAVLIRALEPLQGLPFMRTRRHQSETSRLASGPGKLTQAFQITLDQQGHDLTQFPFFISEDHSDGKERQPLFVGTSGRVGISKAQERPYRFYLQNNACVSKKGKR